MSAAPGRLWLMPNTLDFGAPGVDIPDIQEVLPLGVLRQAAALGHWVAENAKTTRAFLKRVNRVVPLAHPLQSIQIVELPRATKGTRTAPAVAHPMATLLQPLFQGHDMGLISEAGLPAVADPGALLVRAAHEAGVSVVALPGPSSLMLSLAASGLQGQHFAFVGYLPIEAQARLERIKELETVSRKLQQSQLMIETPYRNTALLGALLSGLQPGTNLSVSCGLTLGSERTRSATVGHWKLTWGAELPNDLPAVFALMAG